VGGVVGSFEGDDVGVSDVGAADGDVFVSKVVVEPALAFATAIDPPTPPPTAAATITKIKTAHNKNVVLRKPRIFFSGGYCSA